MQSPRPVIPGYEILTRIGCGAMGEVYRAWEPVLGREVAVKVIKPARAADPSWRARFRREAKVLARIHHPNIAALFNIHEHNGELSIVMEYVDGVNLRDWLAAGPLKAAEAIEICRQIALGLAAAHEVGVIHRDVKPDNVRINSRNVVKLLDFGLARPGDEVSSMGLGVAVEPGRTCLGAVLGTPGYMSPEQARGDCLDVRSDVFSLGCVLFECLTGFRAQRHGPVVEGPDWSLMPNGVPSPLVDLTRKCLAERATSRPPGIDHVVAGLDASAASMRPTAPSLLTAASDVLITEAFSGAGGAATAVHNLPDLPPMVGREREAAEVERLLGRMRLVSVCGIGGAGKTRLALHVAQHAAETGVFSDGVRLVKLAGVNAARQVPGAVAAVLGVRERSGLTLTQRICEELKTREMLLLLDNCEHVAPACVKLVDAVLRASPATRVLATSREALGGTAEQSYQLSPMTTNVLPAGGQSMGTAPEPVSEAAALFLQRAVQAWPPFEATGSTMRSVESICRRAGGLPLAIELAASLVDSMTPEEIDARLAGDPAFADRARTEVGEEGRLAASIAWSLDRLTSKQQTLLRRLARFPGEFTHEAAEQIAADPDTAEGCPVESEVLGLLLQLVRKSLVFRARSGGEFMEGVARFGVLELVRTQCLARPMNTDETRDFDRRYALYYDSVAARRAAPRRAEREWEFAAQRADYPNLRRAMELAQTGAFDPEVAVRLSKSMGWYWYQLWAPSEGLAWIEPAIERRWSVVGSAANDLLQGEACAEAGMLLWMAGGEHLPRSVERYRQALGVFEVIGDRKRMAGSRANLGLVLQDTGRAAEARVELEASIVEFRALGDATKEAQTRLNLGLLEMGEGRYEIAKGELECCLSEFRRTGDFLRGSATISNLGVIEYRLGRPAEGLRLLCEAMRQAARANNGYGIANTADMAGLCCWRLGRLDAAAALFGFADSKGIANLRSNARHREDHAAALREITAELGSSACLAAIERGRGTQSALDLVPAASRDA